MVKQRSIIITEKMRDDNNSGVQTFRFDIKKNGKPDYLELDLFNMLEELEKNKNISMRKIYNMFKSKYGLDVGDIIYYKKQDKKLSERIKIEVQ